MGINFGTGRFAALTNVRSRADRPTGQSRGALVTGAIGASPAVDAQSIPDFTAYNMWSGTYKGGNPMVSFTRSWPSTNAPHGWQSAQSTLRMGECIAHSNEESGDQWDDSWPKTRWLRAKATELLDALPLGTDAEALRDLLADVMLESNDFAEGGPCTCFCCVYCSCHCPGS